MTVTLSSISIRTSIIRFPSPTPASAAWKKTRTALCGFQRFPLLSVAMICVTAVSLTSQARGNIRRTIPNSSLLPTIPSGYGTIRTDAAESFIRMGNFHHKRTKKNRAPCHLTECSSSWKVPKEKYGLVQTRDC